MGSLYAKDVISNCWNNIDAECGKTNEFSAELDAIGYFNTPKNGVANSCSIFLCDMTYRSTRNSSGDIDPDKWDAEYFLYQPDKSAGAGCTQQAGYFRSGDAFFTDPSEAEKGDWVFFTNDGGETFYHVGLIVDWGYVEELGCDGFTTIEGNTNGGYVAYKYYRYDDSRIGGFGRPRYDGYEYPTSEKEPNHQKEDSKPSVVVNIPMPVLKKGCDDRGTVLTIQALLREFEFTDDFGNMAPLSGVFDDATEQCVKAYQEARGLTVNGIVNEETWNRILK